MTGRDTPSVVRWTEWAVDSRWRDEVVGDLLQEHAERTSVGVHRGWSELRLGAAVLRAGVITRARVLQDGIRSRTGEVGGGMGSLAQDTRFALRGLRRSPLFASVALFTLAAGIGLTLAVFAVVDGVLLRPLDYPESDRLVLLQGPSGARRALSMPAHLLFRDESGSLEGAAAWQGWAPVIRSSQGSPSRRIGASVSADYFAVAGVSPAAGRFFDASHGAPGHEPVVVLGHDFWRSRFGGDPDVMGQMLTLDGEDHRILGVAPADFVDPVSRGLGWPDRELWRAHPPLFDEARDDVGWVAFWSLGRLVEGADASDLTREMRGLISARYPERDLEEALRELRAVTLKESVVEDVRPTLIAVLVAVGAVLLIVCANLANLLLSRASVRRGELAVRSSLGADRSRLVRQLMTESVVLALASALLGLVLAVGFTRVILQLVGPSLPRAGEVGVSGGVLVFAALTALGAAVLFGVVPALRMSAAGVAEAAGKGSRGRLGTREGGVLRRGLVVVETALAMALLSTAGLLVGSYLRLQAVDPGFDPEPVVTMSLGLDPERFPEPALQRAALRRVEARVQGIPGVVAVGSITDLPMSGAVNSTRIWRDGDTEADAASRRNVLVRAVTPGYTRALGVPVLRGSPIDGEATAGAEEVAVVNREFVRRFYPTEDPLGQLVTVRGVNRRIVGVVADVREFDLTGSGRDPVLYTPYEQEREGWMRRGTELVIRVAGDPGEVGPEIRRAVVAAAPDVLVGEVRPLAALVDAQLRVPRFRATLILVFAGFALLLAVVGLGGVVAYGVSRRIPEIGLRLALGARGGDVLRMVIRETGIMIVIGIVIGLGVALFAGQAVAGFLFQVPPRDPLVLGGAALVLLTLGTIAAWLPARRAARVDPVAALRAE